MNRPLAALAATALAVVVAGCGPTTSPSGGSSSSTTLTVFAAASLKNTFTTLGQQFEAAHPGTEVTFNFAGSSDLATQLQNGAPADVFASADTTNMTKATAAKLVAGTPVDFATNTLEIAVPPGNPAHITSFSDLAEPGVKVVVCAPAVPCGAAAQKVETASGVTLKPVSEENAVTDVLTKVETAEADAGLVKGAGSKVVGVRFPEAKDAVNTYPIAALSGSKNADLAVAFTALVTGAAGQQVLADAGFAKP
jgi:molybdate transport system substrate-binding protein